MSKTIIEYYYRKKNGEEVRDVISIVDFKEWDKRQTKDVEAFYHV